jgi:hypothetical protein
VKLGVVAYVPPAGRLYSDAFVANILKFPPKHPLFLISDDAEHNPSRLIKNPEMVGHRPAWAVNNLVFLRGLELARDAGLDFYLWLESDSRVGCKEFDAVIFEELFTRYPNGIAIAGSPVVWDMNAGGRRFALAVVEMAWQYQEAGGIPMSFYSGKHPHDTSGAALYVNGSCAVYETSAMLKVFDLEKPTVDISILAKRTTAYDLEIGRRLWTYHGPKAIDHVGFLTRTISCFGDCVMNAEERKAMLLSGRCSIIHQIKDDWAP